jgi:hypothetical protein
MSWLSAYAKLIPQPGDCPIEEGQGPAALEDSLGRLVVDWLTLVDFFPVPDLEGERCLPTAPVVRKSSDRSSNHGIVTSRNVRF